MDNKKEIPKKLSDCTKTNEMAKHLQTWALRIEALGSILFCIIVAVGVIVTIFETVETHNFRSENDYYLEDMARLGMQIPRTGETFLRNLLTWSVYAIIEYCIYHTLVLLISALASMTQNTEISANVALLQASKEFPEEIIEKTQKKSSKKSAVKLNTVQDKIEKDFARNTSGNVDEFTDWIKDTSTEDLMLILQDQRELYSEEELDIINTVLDSRNDGSWICEKCGARNLNPFALYCKGCGKHR